MVFLLGVSLPDHKPVKYALTSFYGIGRITAEAICARLSFHDTLKIQDLTETQLTRLSQILNGMTLESDLKRDVQKNIARYVQIRSYKGLRHSAGLPVHGQRTRTNAKTAKKLNRITRRYSTFITCAPRSAAMLLERITFPFLSILKKTG
ncbi:ribosomal protein subunit S37 [Schizosaccharomyces japonicus yFS275]|uniref:Small ribosomal subunit protein uS13m n=1 Tax=Schizosaccharomyces japonicus (strain yFS275 / FY16936) TaxID=402676 RepID=B6JWK5_SCHJY|nr:ribosomal protein subunit S37 [Schizosaccharomyces japonicus yFS275]EEB05756.2 ribosomal protein subunit S37 [Schizosaccharomyces japonicus yFS275]